MAETGLDVYKQLRTAQDKYTYFLLAAAGACVALTVNRTQGCHLAWSMIPLGIAALCWGISFFCGCQDLRYTNSILYANYELIQVQNGTYPGIGSNVSAQNAASEGLRRAITDNGDRVSRYAVWQFKLLIVGGIAYMVWHICTMYTHS